MNLYVFITPSLLNIGGAQMYIRNKLLFLQSNGWRVIVITGKGGHSLLPELQEYQDCFPELLYEKYYYPINKQRRVVNRIVDIIKQNKSNVEELVIESHTIATSLWAEEIAKVTKAKHIIYLLNEKVVITNKNVFRFLYFKLKRRELVTISRNGLKNMFAPFVDISSEQSYVLSARCNNAEADVDNPFLYTIDKNRFDFIVGGVSRLDKPFVIPAVTAFCQYAELYKEKKFLLLWIGDAPNNCSTPSMIKEMISVLPNVELLITGYLYPVPTRLLELCDVFISSAGSSRACMRSGVPTIVFDGNDHLPIGILGRTTKHAMFRDETEPPQDFIQLMNQILIEKQFMRIPANYNTALPNYQSHMEFLAHSDTEQKYYDTNTKYVVSLKDLVIRLVGPAIVTKVLRFRSPKQTK